MEDLKADITILKNNIHQAIAKLDLTAKTQALEDLESQMGNEDFWNDQTQAAKISTEHSHLKEQVAKWQALSHQAEDLAELADTGDAKLLNELTKQYQSLKTQFEAAEFEVKLNGPYDQSGAIISIHAGTGGTDAMDWAQMLERMYMRWAEIHDIKAELVSESAAEEAGIKSATIKLDGHLVYGRLKGEHGVHRLVRKSPFNSDNLRQTSFALVEVLPQIEDKEAAGIEEKDLKVDVFRAGGAGGQSVNKTSSAVRMTHVPTGITVSIQNERSQLQNKQTALKIIQAKLAHLAAEQQQAEIAKLKGPNIKAEWGRQIRNYVFDPYQLVKDLRSGHETQDVEGVLAGNLDGFIEAYLASQIGVEK